MSDSSHPYSLYTASSGQSSSSPERSNVIGALEELRNSAMSSAVQALNAGAVVDHAMHLSVADDANRQLQLATTGDSSIVGSQAVGGIASFLPESAQRLVQRHMGSAYIGPSAAQLTIENARVAIPIARGELPIPDSDRLRFAGPEALRLLKST
jgi:hypothetical protein